MLGLLALFALLLVAFVVVERRQPRPMFDLALFRRPAFVAVSLMPVLLAFGFVCLLVILPSFFIGVGGMSATRAGLTMLLLTGPVLVFPLISGAVARRVPPRVLLAVSLLLIGAGAAWLTVLSRDTPVAALIGPMLVIGSGGAGSTVRDMLGLEFHGATYPNLFILADTRVEGAVHYYCSDNGILVMVPLPNSRFRVFTAGPPTMRREDLDVALLQKLVDERGPGGLALRDVGWHTTFSIHARHTDRFHRGRVFLAGDAAHIHSPAGGQGLNPGVTDANNLAWKLAMVHRGALPAAVLETYGVERASVATAVVKQAEWQTRAWLFKKSWQVALRDNGVRLAQRTGVFDRWYAPWLAGLTNHYPAGPMIADGERSGPLTSGRLAPSHPVIELGAAHVAPLREVLPTGRYTLLITLPPGRTLDNSAVDPILAKYEDLLDLRVLDGFGVRAHAALAEPHPEPSPPPATRPGRAQRSPA